MAIKREDLKVGGEYMRLGGQKVKVTAIGHRLVLFFRVDDCFDDREFWNTIEDSLKTWSKPKKKVKFDFYIHYYDDGKFLSSSSSMSAGIRGRIKIEHIEREIEVDDE